MKFKSTFYYRDTKTDYDKSDTQEESVTSDNKMYAFQTGFERVVYKIQTKILFFIIIIMIENIENKERKINIIVSH